MGYQWKLKKEEKERLCRERERLEKFSDPGLETLWTPQHATRQFRCESLDGAGIAVQHGDQVLLFRSGSEVKVLKNNTPVGIMTPAALGDFGNASDDEACSDYQLAEVVSEPSALDQTFDVERRPPWNEPKPSKK